MDVIVHAWKALVAQPMALLMAGVALLCTIIAVSFGVRVRDRLALAALAFLSAMSAWIMASRWRWPS